ncbi:MAG: class I SAM-dependent methyltransferase [Planctomycetota bacterium]
MDHQSFLEHAAFEQRHWWFRARRRIIHQVLRELIDPGQQSVLEIGCGTGANSAALARHFDVRGVDISGHAIDLAKASFPEVSFRCYRDLDQIDAWIGQASAILMLDVWEHIRDEFEFLSELTCRTRPGAFAIVTVPADPDLWSEHDEALFHYRRYDAKRLAMVWDGLPWTPIAISGLNYRLAPLIRAIRKWQPRRESSSSPRTHLKQPSQWVNRTLEAIFAGESKFLIRQLRREQPPVDDAVVPHRNGVSLFAVLRRDEGRCQPRVRPSDCPADLFDPPKFDLGVSTKQETKLGEVCNSHDAVPTP